MSKRIIFTSLDLLDANTQGFWLSTNLTFTFFKKERKTEKKNEKKKENGYLKAFLINC